MSRNAKPRLFALLVIALLLLAAMPVAQASSAPLFPTPLPTATLPQPATQISGALPPGGWMAFTFQYPGDYSKIGVILDYSPTDDPNDVGKLDGGAVVLSVYSPISRPPGGKPIDTAKGNNGQKYWQMESGVGGIYSLVVNNWYSLGRPVTFSIRTVALGTGSDPFVAPPGPVLTLVGSSARATAGIPAATPEPSAPAPTPTPVPTPTAPAVAGQTGTLSAGGGWAAYNLPYPGDGSKVAVVLDYSPSDDPRDVGQTNGVAVILAAYSPVSLPPSGSPIAFAGGNGGQKVWQLTSSQSGNYLLLVNNWDSLGRPVQYKLRTVAVQANGDLVNGPVGPALTLVSTGG
jgi:hypothetical protein